jgi:L-lactate dehydrogenase complex protein LldE
LPGPSPITIPVRGFASSGCGRSRDACSHRSTASKEADVCCGFGGTFCVKYPDISNAIVEKKTAAIAASGAATLLAGDLGCLMNMAGKLQRQNIPVASRHVAEVLAGMTELPPIGEAG